MSTAKTQSKKPTQAGILTALLAVQAAGLKFPHDQEGQIAGTSKTGKAYGYTYRYTSLAKIREIVDPVLSENGLVIYHFVQEANLYTVLAHTSTGETLTTVFPRKLEGTPQQIGGVMTYAKRYNISALLNIATSTDEDGMIGDVIEKAGKMAAEAIKAMNSAKTKKQLRELFAKNKDEWSRSEELVQLFADLSKKLPDE